MELDDNVGKWGIQDNLELGLRIRKKGTFMVKNTGVAHRTINHWDEWGLIDFDREDTTEWRRMSFHDLIWVMMVNQFRKMGTSVKLILMAKKQVLQRHSMQAILDTFVDDPKLAQRVKEDALKHASDEDKEKINAFHANPKVGPGFESMDQTLLQSLIVNTITTKTPISLALFEDGTVFPLVNFQPNPLDPEFLFKLAYENYTSVSVTGLIKNFLAKPSSIIHLPKLKLLSPNETQILEIIHSGDYKSVKINFKKGKLKGMELEKNQETGKRIVDVLQEGNFQEIVIKQYHGKITSFTNVQRVSFN